MAAAATPTRQPPPMRRAHGVARAQRVCRRSVGAGAASSAAADAAAAAGAAEADAATRPPLATASLSPAQLAANAALADAWRGRLILAPLTRVGTKPFRRLAAEFGAQVTLSEMAFARPLARGDRVERARMRNSAGLERVFGVQLASNNADELVAAARLAADAGARFVDINAGCPIHEATRRVRKEREEGG